MINLIPNQEKKKMTKEFYLRLSIVIMNVLTVLMIAACVALAPSYFVVSIKKDFAKQKLEDQKALPKPEINQELMGSIALLNQQIDLIKQSQEDKFVVSQRVINDVFLKKPDDIKIISVSYNDTGEEKGKVINIKGVADSRDGLLAYKNILENDVNFEEADLPISSFLKNTDIEFNLRLVPVQ